VENLKKSLLALEGKESPGQNQKDSCTGPAPAARLREQLPECRQQPSATNLPCAAFDFQMGRRFSSSEARSRSGCRTAGAISKSQFASWRRLRRAVTTELAGVDKISLGKAGHLALALALRRNPTPVLEPVQAWSELECELEETFSARCDSSRTASPLSDRSGLKRNFIQIAALIQPVAVAVVTIPALQLGRAGATAPFLLTLWAPSVALRLIVPDGLDSRSTMRGRLSCWQSRWSAPTPARRDQLTRFRASGPDSLSGTAKSWPPREVPMAKPQLQAFLDGPFCDGPAMIGAQKWSRRLHGQF